MNILKHHSLTTPKVQKPEEIHIEHSFILKKFLRPYYLIPFFLILFTIITVFLFSQLQKYYLNQSLSSIQISESTKSAHTPPNFGLPNDKIPPPPCFQNGKSLLDRGVANNRYGMYMVVDASSLPMNIQIPKIAELVNSNGGDWGYILFPLWIDNFDQGKWEEFFELTAQYHLTPIIQLQTSRVDPAYMVNNLQKTATFLDSFYWATSCRYISVFNEPNNKDYWEETLDPAGYARILDKSLEIFKNTDENFFMMNAGFNASCRSGPRYMDEEEYLIAMNAEIPGIFSKLDGWATHPYPQPEFSGDYYNPPSWYEQRDQIKEYLWEQELLKNHFNVSGLPLFFTETGWAHAEGNQPKSQYQSSSLTATYFDDAFKNLWTEEDIVAITPFVFNLGSFSNFNWIDHLEQGYAQCEVLKNIPKTAGAPK